MANTSLRNSTKDALSCLFLFTEFDHVKYIAWTLVFAGVINSVLAVATVIGNTIVLLTIWRNPSLHTPSNTLLFSLAFSDLGVGLLVQPIYVIYKLSELNQNFQVYCISGVASEFLALMFTSTAFLTIGTISVERYLAIHLHLRYNELVTVSRVVKVIILLWCFGLTCSIMRSFVVLTRFSYDLTFSVFGTIFAAVFVITVVCYIKIWLTIRRHIKQEVHPSIPMNTSEHGASTSRDGGSNHGNIQMKQMKKSVITMLYIVGAFAGCYVPYSVVIMICKFLEWNPFARGLFNVVFPTIFLNSGLNPVLYFWRMREFRILAKVTIFKITGINLN